MIDPERCPKCPGGPIDGGELEWDEEQTVRFWCEGCGCQWKVKVTMQSEIIPDSIKER